MARTSVNNVIAKIKRRFDYDIVDTNLDTLIIDAINDSLKVISQLFTDYGIYEKITNSGTLKTITNQAYKQFDQASIIGDQTTFTGVAGDKINVTNNGTTVTVSINACTTIAAVVAAINLAVGSTVASETSDGYLKITSSTTGSTSSVTIADGTAGNGGEAARLFSVANSRTDTAIADIDQILTASLRQADSSEQTIQKIDYNDLIAYQPDPTSSSADTFDCFAIWNNRIYFAPTPSKVISVYLDYIALLTEVVSGGTMPFDAKYDPLVVAMVIRELTSWLDSSNATAISQANNRVEELKNNLIIGASKNYNTNRQTESRRTTEPYFNPRMVK